MESKKSRQPTVRQIREQQRIAQTLERIGNVTKATNSIAYKARKETKGE